MNYAKYKYKSIENLFLNGCHSKHKVYIKLINKPIEILDVTGYIEDKQENSYTYLYNIITHTEKIQCKCINDSEKIKNDIINSVFVGLDSKGKNQYIELISN